MKKQRQISNVVREFFSKKFEPRKTKASHLRNLALAIRENKKLAKDLLSLPQEAARACRVCGGKNQHSVLKVNGFLWVHCPSCDHWYKKHMPRADLMEARHKKAPLEIYLTEKDMNYRLREIATPKVGFALKFLRKQKGRWLDLGTGLGDVPYVARKRGFKVEATELSPSFVSFAKKRFSLESKPVTLQRFYEKWRKDGSKPFDVISAFGYFDLVPDPVKEMKICKEMLSRRSLLVINQPNHDSMTGMLARWRPETSVRVIAPNNYSYYSKKSLQKALELAGFKVLGVWWYGMDIHEVAVRFLELNPAFGKSEAYDFLYDNFNELQKVIDQKRRSDFVMMCAQKI